MWVNSSMFFHFFGLFGGLWREWQKGCDLLLWLHFLNSSGLISHILLALNLGDWRLWQFWTRFLLIQNIFVNIKAQQEIGVFSHNPKPLWMEGFYKKRKERKGYSFWSNLIWIEYFDEKWREKYEKGFFNWLFPFLTMVRLGEKVLPFLISPFLTIPRGCNFLRFYFHA